MCTWPFKYSFLCFICVLCPLCVLCAICVFVLYVLYVCALQIYENYKIALNKNTFKKMNSLNCLENTVLCNSLILLMCCSNLFASSRCRFLFLVSPSIINITTTLIKCTYAWSCYTHNYCYNWNYWGIITNDKLIISYNCFRAHAYDFAIIWVLFEN